MILQSKRSPLRGYILGCVALLSLALDSATWAAEPNGHYKDFKLLVTAVISLPSGAYVYFDKYHHCGANRVYFARSRNDFDTLYSSFLTAQISKQYVSVDLRDSSVSASCNGAHSTVGNICIGDEGSPCFSGW